MTIYSLTERVSKKLGEGGEERECERERESGRCFIDDQLVWIHLITENIQRRTFLTPHAFVNPVPGSLRSTCLLDCELQTFHQKSICSEAIDCKDLSAKNKNMLQQILSAMALNIPLYSPAKSQGHDVPPLPGRNLHTQRKKVMLLWCSVLHTHRLILPPFQRRDRKQSESPGCSRPVDPHATPLPSSRARWTSPILSRDWYLIAEQPAAAPHFVRPEGRILSTLKGRAPAGPTGIQPLTSPVDLGGRHV